MAATSEESEVQYFYDRKTVLITGGTGFVGKLVVEKLLRSCPTVNKLYLLARPKKGKSSETRLVELFDDLVFAEMKKLNPDFYAHVELIEGDIEKPELGISLCDKNKILKEVDIIIHSAANVKFDLSLKEALMSNTRATRDLLELAKQCEKLSAFVYVSTAFSNCNRKHISETIYEPTVAASKILHVAETFDENTLEKMKESLQVGFCNTYVMSKYYSEGVISEYEGFFPIVIVRPSVVTSTQKEPVKGWCCNINGFYGFMVAAGLGVMHTMKLKKDHILDVVPADKVSNCIVASAWYISTVERSRVLVLNCVSSPQNPVTMYKFLIDHDKIAREYPLERAVGYYSVTFTESRLISTLIWFLTQWLYAHIVDAILMLLGKKPMLLNAIKKIDKANEAINFFLFNDFTFDNDNYKRMAKDMNDYDKMNFGFDISDINWHEYCVDSAYGVARYILKEPYYPNIGQTAIRKQKWLFVLYYGYLTLIVVSFARLCGYFFSLVWFLLTKVV